MADALQPTDCDEADADDDDALIRMRVEELNQAIIAANARGMRVSLGIASFSTRPPHTQVRVSIIERSRGRYRG